MPNFVQPSFESITVLDQMPLTSRQHLFPIFRHNKTKISLNTTANKFYQLSGKITLDSLGCSFVHFKKWMKIQFLKYGKTWIPLISLRWISNFAWYSGTKIIRCLNRVIKITCEKIKMESSYSWDCASLGSVCYLITVINYGLVTCTKRSITRSNYCEMR